MQHRDAESSSSCEGRHAQEEAIRNPSGGQRLPPRAPAERNSAAPRRTIKKALEPHKTAQVSAKIRPGRATILPEKSCQDLAFGLAKHFVNDFIELLIADVARIDA